MDWITAYIVGCYQREMGYGPYARPDPIFDGFESRLSSEDPPTRIICIGNPTGPDDFYGYSQWAKRNESPIIFKNFYEGDSQCPSSKSYGAPFSFTGSSWLFLL